MPKPRRQYPGLSNERKRSLGGPLELASVPETSMSTSSSFYRSGSGYYDGSRSDSPPASTYFPTVSEDQEAAPLPTPGADQHFAYSTTLRRHHTEDSIGDRFEAGIRDIVEEGPKGLWARITGDGADGIENGHGNGNGSANGYHLAEREPTKDTPSARYAHYTAEQTLADFATSPAGLALAQIASLRSIHGYNEFSVEAPEPVLLKFAKTIYESPLILLLCGSAVVSAVMGNIDDAVSIAVAVLIVLTVGFVQEQRSEKSLEALNKLVPHHCHVLRGGASTHLLANELVPGDIVTLTTGDRVPADIRLIDALDLEIDESSLTGETVARRKGVNACALDVGGGAAALADRTCVGYMGTLVRNGRGTGVVIAIGAQTEFGVIFSMMQDVEEKRTPLQLSMDELAKKLSIISFAVIGVICLIGVLQSRSWLEMFTIGGAYCLVSHCLFVLLSYEHVSSFACGSSNSGRPTYSNYRHSRIGCAEDGETQGNREEAA